MTRDQELTEFLQWALPRLRMRWAGFRKVRGQVGKRLARRMRELGLTGGPAYRAYLEQNPEEWVVLDGLLYITISRFRRDRVVWDSLERYILPALYERARRWGRRDLKVWCAGCGAGEEPYTLALVHELLLSREFHRVRPELLATDSDAGQLARARDAIYPRGALKDLPTDWVEIAFEECGRRFRLRPEYRRRVTFRRQDVRATMPLGPLGLVLCRNMAFTYFEEELQREILAKLRARMRDRAFLVIGGHERLPDDGAGFELWRPGTGIWIKGD